jgi:hypothetical protein
MIPLGAIRYLFFSTIFVVSLVVGLRCILAHDYRREAWRSSIKRRIYFSRKSFKVTSISLGWSLLVLSLFVAYFQILDLLEA